MALVRICNLHLNVSPYRYNLIRLHTPGRCTRSSGYTRCWTTGETWFDWRLWQHVFSTGCGPQRGYRGLNFRGVRPIPHFHLVPKLRMCGVRLHSPIHLHDVYKEFDFLWFSPMRQNLGLQGIYKGHVLRDWYRDRFLSDLYRQVKGQTWGQIKGYRGSCLGTEGQAVKGPIFLKQQQISGCRGLWSCQRHKPACCWHTLACLQVCYTDLGFQQWGITAKGVDNSHLKPIEAR